MEKTPASSPSPTSPHIEASLSENQLKEGEQKKEAEEMEEKVSSEAEGGQQLKSGNSSDVNSEFQEDRVLVEDFIKEGAVQVDEEQEAERDRSIECDVRSKLDEKMGVARAEQEQIDEANQESVNYDGLNNDDEKMGVARKEKQQAEEANQESVKYGVNYNDQIRQVDKKLGVARAEEKQEEESDQESVNNYDDLINQVLLQDDDEEKLHSAYASSRNEGGDDDPKRVAISPLPLPGEPRLAPPMTRQSPHPRQLETSQPGAVAVTGSALTRNSIARRNEVLDSRQGRPADENRIGELGRRRTAAELLEARLVVSEEFHGDDDAEPQREEMPQALAVSEHKLKRNQYIIWAVVVTVVLVLAATVGLAVGLSVNKDSNNAAATHAPTGAPSTEMKRPALERIMEADILKCGVVNSLPGFSFLNESTGQREGIEVDLCRAVAAAILGNPDSVELTVLTNPERFPALSNGTVDLLAHTATHTMERDVHERNTRLGYSFTVPYMYGGLRFGGLPFFVACADNLRATGECEGLRVCVRRDSTHFDILSGLLPRRNIVLFNSVDRSQALTTGECNVVSGESSVYEVNIRLGGYTGEYALGNNVFSKEPLAMVTPDDDPQFFELVNWVFQSLLVAEARGITQATAATIGRTQLFGDQFEDLFINAISAVGNYGEMYERHLEALVPREGLNLLNTEGTTGLIYSHPFGKVDNEGPGPIVNGTLGRIKNRGELICGVLLDAESGGDRDFGMGKDYCRALAAGSSVSVRFVELSGADVAFDALTDKDVDVVSGASVTLSGRGHSFSQPYFYLPLTDFEDDSLRFGEALALATRQDDEQWSAFVYWTVTVTFYAEEEGISISKANDMPLVDLFGSDYIRMFRDSILAVGNYGDLYERNAGLVVPRSGRNLLNSNPSGPQFYPPSLQ